MWNRTAVIINLDAVRSNIKSVRSLVGNTRHVWPAVKANAYGHGVIPVSQACIQAGADGLCVATINEAAQLIDAGINLPILELGCLSVSEAEAAVKLGIRVTLCDINLATELSKAADALGKKISVHLKVDTGMGRIGLRENEIYDFALKVSQLPGLILEGLFTHFPTADEEDRTFTQMQIDELSRISVELRSKGLNIPMVHAANSAGILAFKDSYFDGVRPGIMIYGQYPSPQTPKTVALQPAFTLKSRISFLKRVPAKTSVSYGRTHFTHRESLIATVPVGYGDGYPRALSNRGFVAVKGLKAPIVGRICMDQLMIDVTDVHGVHMGEEVILYGGGYEYLDVGKIASELDTISYELFCNVSSRVPRVYVHE